MNTPNDFTSIGRIACELQIPVANVQAIIQKLDIAPSQRLNGLAFFDRSAVDRIGHAARSLGMNQVHHVTASPMIGRTGIH